ncbi:MAG: hypothetical protein HY067_08380 [Betaproteobacteria bacterium]|nr:hypothetical protein [Betaproteobacteria bacterium]
MKSLRVFGFATLTLLLPPALAAAEDVWTQNDGYLKSAINDCSAVVADRAVCRNFIGEALNRLFGIGEFCTRSRCMKAVEIEWKIRHDPGKWSALGTANDQAVLDKAREFAGTKAVLAILNEEERGQIAIVMPGAAVPSGRWGLKVPIGVGARVDRPEASVYAKSLNWLFADPAKVVIYVRL